MRFICRRSVRAVALIVIAVGSVLTSGCFVLESEKQYKPEGPVSQVNTDKHRNEIVYSRLVQAEDFDVEIRIGNTPGTWNLAFLFWVLPFPMAGDYVRTQPLTVDFFVEPKSSQIAFDPAKTFFASAKQPPVPPRRIYYNNDWFGTNDSRAFPLATRTHFVTEFSLWNEAHLNPYKPFSLELKGLRANDSPVSLSPVTFTPVTVVRPKFRLPY